MASSKLAYPSVQYMITRPVILMTNILLAKIPRGHIWVGTDRDRYILLNDMKYTLMQLKIEDNIELKTKIDNLKKEIELKFIQKKTEELDKKHTDVKNYDKKYTDTNQLFVNIEINDMLYTELELLYEDKSQLDVDIYLQYNGRARSKDGIPLLFEPPIDHENKNLNLNVAPIDDTNVNWKLTKKDGTILEFKCPGWYLANSPTIDEEYFNHPNLNNNYLNIFEGDKLPNVIVDIDLAVEESLIPLLDYND
jgi:hypothetical protein